MERFDAVWTYGHVSGVSANADWVLDPWVALTAIAGATERIHLGPLVLNATIRHPAHIAAAAATLQNASGGRVMLGMGAGTGHDRGRSGNDRPPTTLSRRTTRPHRAATVLLMFAALPVFSMQLGFADAGNDPEGTTTRQAYDLLEEGYGHGANGPLILVTELLSAVSLPQVQAVSEALRQVEGISQVCAGIPNDPQSRRPYCGW